jgi:hypothetical protein
VKKPVLKRIEPLEYFDQANINEPKMIRAATLLALVLTKLAGAQSDEQQIKDYAAELALENIDFSMLERHPGRRSLQSEPPGFSIDLAFVGSMTNDQKAGFLAARDKWMTIVSADSASTACVQAGQRLCGLQFSSETCIDDLLIIAKVSPIDGVGRV